MRNLLRSSLAASEATARLLEELGFGAWEWRPDDDGLTWTANLGPLLGKPAGHRPERLGDMLDLLHPEDRPRLEEAIETAVRGVDTFEEVRCLLPDGNVRWLGTRLHVAGDEEGASPSVIGLVTDDGERHRKLEDDRFLADAGRLLASSLEYDETVQRVVDVVVPRLADRAVLHMWGADDLCDVREASRDSGGPRLAEAGAVAALAREVADREEPVVVSGLAQAEAAGGSLLEAAKEVADAGLRSFMVLPLVVTGEPDGALTLASAQPGIPGSDQVLARRVVERAAVAIAHARLHRRIEEGAARLRALHTVTSRLASAYSTSEVAEAAIRQAVEASGAARGTLVLADPVRGEVRLAAAAGYPDVRIASWSESLNQGETPIGVALRSGAPVFLPDEEVLARSFPRMAALRPLGRAWAAVPMAGREGAIGAIGLAFDHPQAFPPEVVAFLEAVSRQCAVALERARLHAQTLSIADALQQALVPSDLPDVPGIEARAHYSPGGIGDVGGDWFDLVPTAGGRAVAVVGDVVGRGIPAVSAMARYRFGLRLLLQEGHGPVEALDRLNRLSDAGPRDGSGFTTIACAEHDPSSGLLRVALAGHPPPILKTAGSCRLVQAPTCLPVGVVPDAWFEDTTVRLEDGPAVLVLYTDGTVERRGRPIDGEIARLASVVEAAPLDVDEILASVVATLPDADTGDDTTVLVVGLETGG